MEIKNFEQCASNLDHLWASYTNLIRYAKIESGIKGIALTTSTLKASSENVRTAALLLLDEMMAFEDAIPQETLESLRTIKKEVEESK